MATSTETPLISWTCCNAAAAHRRFPLHDDSCRAEVHTGRSYADLMQKGCCETPQAAQRFSSRVDFFFLLVEKVEGEARR
mmetsp:Transcript_110072/g.173500  ORF Transcript_110072/g.173500 Transcript_110072/m.173500 type:complete len:80 (-) Transcript_110072:609-848(-)